MMNEDAVPVKTAHYAGRPVLVNSPTLLLEARYTGGQLEALAMSLKHVTAANRQRGEHRTGEHHGIEPGTVAA